MAGKERQGETCEHERHSKDRGRVDGRKPYPRALGRCLKCAVFGLTPKRSHTHMQDAHTCRDICCVVSDLTERGAVGSATARVSTRTRHTARAGTVMRADTHTHTPTHTTTTSSSFVAVAVCGARPLAHRLRSTRTGAGATCDAKLEQSRKTERGKYANVHRRERGEEKRGCRPPTENNNNTLKRCFRMSESRSRAMARSRTSTFLHRQKQTGITDATFLLFPLPLSLGTTPDQDLIFPTRTHTRKEK